MMIGFRISTLRQTYAALAAFQCHHPSMFVSSMVTSSTTSNSKLRQSSQQQSTLTRITSRLFASSSSSTGNSNSDTSTVFQPAPPPGTHGTPVFPNIDLSNTSPEAQLRNESPHAVCVVTGANRGIGFQFTKSLLLDHTRGTVVACCRNPNQADDLLQLQQSLPDPSRLHLVSLDVQDQTSIAAAGTEIRQKYSRVDLLLNVAGILGDAKTTPGPERSLQKMERDWLEQTLAVNLVGPVMFTKELLPLLMQKRRRGARSSADDESTEEQAPRPPSIVANLSARVGSISDNQLGGWYSYRMSKAALNQATRTLALELKRHQAWAVALHPGTTDTGLSRPFQANVAEGSLFPVDFTVAQLLRLLDGMEERHSGGLYDWSGQALSF